MVQTPTAGHRVLFANLPRVPHGQTGNMRRSGALLDVLRSEYTVDYLEATAGRGNAIAVREEAGCVSYTATVRTGRFDGYLGDTAASTAFVDREVGLDRYRLIVGHNARAMRPIAGWRKAPKLLDADNLRFSYGAEASFLGTVRASAKTVAHNVLTRRQCLASADHCWIICEEDMDVLPSSFVTYLPHFVRDRGGACASGQDESDDPVLLFVGPLWYEPNFRGITTFVREAWPAVVRALPGARLRIVGDASPALRSQIRGPRVEVLGYVEDLDAEYRRATAVLAPIVSGGGWQTKVSEAMEHAKPVVATTFACRGFSSFARQQDGLATVGSIAEMARPALMLLADPGQARALGARLRMAALSVFPYERFRDTVLGTVRAFLA